MADIILIRLESSGDTVLRTSFQLILAGIEIFYFNNVIFCFFSYLLDIFHRRGFLCCFPHSVLFTVSVSVVHSVPGLFFLLSRRWSSLDGAKLNNDMDAVARPIPTNWTVTKAWFTVASQEDPDGWQYSTDFYAMSWFNKPEPRSTLFYFFSCFVTC